MAPSRLGGQAAGDRRDRVLGDEAAVGDREAHLGELPGRLRRPVAGRVELVAERDHALALAHHAHMQAGRGRIGAEVVAAHEEERAAAAHTGGRLRPPEDHAEALADLVVGERDGLEPLAAELLHRGVARGALGRRQLRAPAAGGLLRRGGRGVRLGERLGRVAPVVAGHHEDHGDPDREQDGGGQQPDHAGEPGGDAAAGALRRPRGDVMRGAAPALVALRLLLACPRLLAHRPPDALRRTGRASNQVKVSHSRKMFRPMIIAATIEAITVVCMRLTSAPMRSARRVSRIIGTSANGMPKLSTTCESTSVSVVLTPLASTISAGVMVIARRRKSGMRKLMKPCITTWPANVPTLELDSPEASSATAKASAAPPPSSVSNPACAPSSEWIDLCPLPWKSWAATISIVRLITPARPIAISTSTRWKRMSSRRSSSFSALIRLWVSAEWR